MHFNNFITLKNAITKLPEDDAEAPKYVGAFVIYICLCVFVYVCVCVCVCVHVCICWYK